jgi:hypothetical protein
MASQKIAFTQGQIKQNAQKDAQIANILTQAVETGKQAATSGRGGNIDITV